MQQEDRCVKQPCQGTAGRGICPNRRRRRQAVLASGVGAPNSKRRTQSYCVRLF